MQAEWSGANESEEVPHGPHGFGCWCGGIAAEVVRESGEAGVETMGPRNFMNRRASARTRDSVQAVFQSSVLEVWEMANMMRIVRSSAAARRNRHHSGPCREWQIDPSTARSTAKAARAYEATIPPRYASPKTPLRPWLEARLRLGS